MKPKNTAHEIAESKRVLAAIKKIDDSLPAALRADRFEGKIVIAETVTGKTETTRAELAVCVEEKKIALTDLYDFRKRLRAAVRAIFGDDSLIYEELGGKRLSNRKRPVRKSPTE